jgi:hypothetical protein
LFFIPIREREYYILGKVHIPPQTTTQLIISPQTFNWDNISPKLPNRCVILVFFRFEIHLNRNYLPILVSNEFACTGLQQIFLHDTMEPKNHLYFLLFFVQNETKLKHH